MYLDLTMFMNKRGFEVAEKLIVEVSPKLNWNYINKYGFNYQDYTNDNKIYAPYIFMEHMVFNDNDFMALSFVPNQPYTMKSKQEIIDSIVYDLLIMIELLLNKKV